MLWCSPKTLYSQGPQQEALKLNQIPAPHSPPPVQSPRIPTLFLLPDSAEQFERYRARVLDALPANALVIEARQNTNNSICASRTNHPGPPPPGRGEVLQQQLQDRLVLQRNPLDSKWAKSNAAITTRSTVSLAATRPQNHNVLIVLRWTVSAFRLLNRWLVHSQARKFPFALSTPYQV